MPETKTTDAPQVETPSSQGVTTLDKSTQRRPPSEHKGWSLSGLFGKKEKPLSETSSDEVINAAQNLTKEAASQSQSDINPLTDTEPGAVSDEAERIANGGNADQSSSDPEALKTVQTSEDSGENNEQNQGRVMEVVEEVPEVANGTPALIDTDAEDVANTAEAIANAKANAELKQTDSESRDTGDNPQQSGVDGSFAPEDANARDTTNLTETGEPADAQLDTVDTNTQDSNGDLEGQRGEDQGFSSANGVATVDGENPQRESDTASGIPLESGDISSTTEVADQDSTLRDEQSDRDKHEEVADSTENTNEFTNGYDALDTATDLENHQDNNEETDKLAEGSEDDENSKVVRSDSKAALDDNDHAEADNDLQASTGEDAFVENRDENDTDASQNKGIESVDASEDLANKHTDSDSDQEINAESEKAPLTAQKAFEVSQRFFDIMDKEFGLKAGDEPLQGLHVEDLTAIEKLVDKDPLDEELDDFWEQHDIALTEDERNKFNEIARGAMDRTYGEDVMSAVDKIRSLKEKDKESVS